MPLARRATSSPTAARTPYAARGDRPTPSTADRGPSRVPRVRRSTPLLACSAAAAPARRRAPPTTNARTAKAASFNPATGGESPPAAATRAAPTPRPSDGPSLLRTGRRGHWNVGRRQAARGVGELAEGTADVRHA